MSNFDDFLEYGKLVFNTLIFLERYLYLNIIKPLRKRININFLKKNILLKVYISIYLWNMNKKNYFCPKNIKMIDAFRRYLSLNGIQYEELNSIINFEYNELKYMFVYDESDTHYFRIILPNIAEVKSDNEKDIYKNINRCNSQIKAAKSTINNESVWISIEQFVYSYDHIDDLYARCMNILQAYFNQFTEK